MAIKSVLPRRESIILRLSTRPYSHSSTPGPQSAPGTLSLPGHSLTHSRPRLAQCTHCITPCGVHLPCHSSFFNRQLSAQRCSVMPASNSQGVPPSESLRQHNVHTAPHPGACTSGPVASFLFRQLTQCSLSGARRCGPPVACPCAAGSSSAGWQCWTCLRVCMCNMCANVCGCVDYCVCALVRVRVGGGGVVSAQLVALFLAGDNLHACVCMHGRGGQKGEFRNSDQAGSRAHTHRSPRLAVSGHVTGCACACACAEETMSV